MLRNPLDLFTGVLSREQRRTRFFRKAIIGAIMFIVGSVFSMVRLWIAISSNETWHDYRGLVIDHDEVSRALVFFGFLAAISTLLLVLLRRWSKR